MFLFCIGNSFIFFILRARSICLFYFYCGLRFRSFRLFFGSSFGFENAKVRRLFGGARRSSGCCGSGSLPTQESSGSACSYWPLTISRLSSACSARVKSSQEATGGWEWFC